MFNAQCFYAWAVALRYLAFLICIFLEPNLCFWFICICFSPFILSFNFFFLHSSAQISAFFPGATIQKINRYTLSSYTQPEGNLDLALTMGFWVFFYLFLSCFRFFWGSLV